MKISPQAKNESEQEKEMPFLKRGAAPQLKNTELKNAPESGSRLAGFSGSGGSPVTLYHSAGKKDPAKTAFTANLRSGRRSGAGSFSGSFYGMLFGAFF